MPIESCLLVFICLCWASSFFLLSLTESREELDVEEREEEEEEEEEGECGGDDEFLGFTGDGDEEEGGDAEVVEE